MLTDVRAAFVNVFEAKKAGDGKGEAKHSIALLFAPDHPAVKLVTDAMVETAKEKWGEKAPDVYKALRAANKLALHDGDEKSQYEGFPGNKYVNASNKARPTVIDGKKQPLTAADGKPYAGCYVNAHIEIWAQDNGYGKRINASILGVQFLRDGEPFSGAGVSTADDFAAVDNPDVFGDEKPADSKEADPFA